MWAVILVISSLHSFILMSFDFLTETSHSVWILSNRFNVLSHSLSVGVWNVSSFLISSSGISKSLNDLRFISFQKEIWVANSAMEWLVVLSFQIACSYVNPSRAVFVGTNHSWLECVFINWDIIKLFKSWSSFLWEHDRTDTIKKTSTKTFNFILFLCLNYFSHSVWKIPSRSNRS